MRRTRRWAVVAASLGALLAMQRGRSIADPTPSPSPSVSVAQMIDARAAHALAPLPDGRWLISGGVSLFEIGDQAIPPWSTAEIFDPATGVSMPTAPMSVGRIFHALVPLADGRVVAIGGEDGSTIAPAEIFDPTTSTWTVAAAPEQLAGIAVVVAPSSGPLGGQLLVIGGGNFSGTVQGASTNTVEVFDPSGPAWRPRSPMRQARSAHTATLLPDGRVLVAGGTADGGVSLSTAEIYDPAADAWTDAAPMNALRAAHTAIALPSGRVLVTGGSTKGIEVGALSSAETYDPKADVWSDAPALAYPRLLHHATKLPSGRVVVTGGDTRSLLDTTHASTADIFDETQGAWVATTSTLERVGEQPALDANGGLWITGGLSDDTNASSEIFAVPFAVDGAACGASTVCESGVCVDGVCCNRACDGACEACDVVGSVGRCAAIAGDPRADHATCAGGFACGAGGCLTSCIADSECARGNACIGGTCVATSALPTCTSDGLGVLSPTNGQVEDCSPYRCVAGTSDGGSGGAASCLHRCATSDDCVAGDYCDGEYAACRLAADEIAPGCAIRPASRDVGGGWLSLSIVAAWAYRRRHVRPKRSHARRAVFTITLFTALSAHGRARSDPTYATSFTLLPPLSDPRLLPFVALLPTGQVLAASGGPSIEVAPLGTELFSPGTATWGPGPPMLSNQFGGCAVQLANGDVILIGGYDGLSFVERYSVSDGTWAACAQLPTAGSARVFAALAACTPLPDGRVLLTGGSGISAASDTVPKASVTAYDPAADVWTSLAPLHYGRFGHTATVLADGRLLVVGGADVSSNTTAEIYDPAVDVWTDAAPLPLPRSGHTATLLADSEVLVVGGSDGAFDYYDPSDPLPRTRAPAFLYDPSADSWTTLAARSRPRRTHVAVPLPTNQILFVGGVDPNSAEPAMTEVLDLATMRFLDAGRFVAPGKYRPIVERFEAGAIFLPSTGDVLVVGGGEVSSVDQNGGELAALPSVEKIHPVTPASIGDVCLADAFCVSGYCVDGVCCDSVCDDVCSVCDAVGSIGTCSTPTGRQAPEGARECPGAIQVCEAGACASTCEESADCAAGLACQDGSCIGPLPIGAACATDADCDLGICADGVCCDEICDQTCEACDVVGAVGACTAIVGPPRPSRSQRCGGFVCVEGGCATSCESAADCDLGLDCVGGSCVAIEASCSPDRSASTDIGGTVTECTPGRCTSNGACSDACSTADDCDPSIGALCDVRSGTCRVPSPPIGGCTVQVLGGGASPRGRTSFTPAAAATALLVAIAGVLRRRSIRGVAPKAVRSRAWEDE